MNNLKSMSRAFILFWLSQAVSQLGSAMTSFALVIWAYKQTGSAMTVSLLTFCSYLPYVLVSFFAGAFVDRHSKKTILLVSDSIAALCTVFVFFLVRANQLSVEYVCFVNTVIGISNAFQNPASTVAVGLMVPKENLAAASGMNSFSSNLLCVVSPVLAAAILAAGGLRAILIADFSTFLADFLTLLFLIQIRETAREHKEELSVIASARDGMHFLKFHRGLLQLILCMAFMNFFSAVTYENILGPMLLARTGGNDAIYGTVSAVLGIGGIIGGLYVSLFRMPAKSIRTIGLCGALSFALGDLLMGLGQNLSVWIPAGLFASISFPLIAAAQNVILYKHVPTEMQGRVFSVRNALQYASIPCGILLGGFLADHVFEPFMQGHADLALFLQKLVGTGPGSGMAVMFLCTAVLGSLSCILCTRGNAIRTLDQ
ncbi:MAG: MFS transporter [Erysipelotrichia bacterium]|nr:MFS transporter [Erysipelotrichia bacterium]